VDKLRVEILVGMIASGKSTYCQKRASEGAIIINDDAIVTAVHGGDYTLYDENLKHLYKSITNNILHMSLALGKHVVIDRPGITRSQRRRPIALANSLEASAVIIKFPMESPEIHAKRRYDHDDRGHTYTKWLDVARYHASIYEEPNENEGYGMIIHIDSFTC
jgi:predicted kinase